MPRRGDNRQSAVRVRQATVVAALLAMTTVVAIPATAQIQFPDVRAGSEHSDAIIELADIGVVLGYNDGNFGPEDPVSRGQIASILLRTDDELAPVTPNFSDVSINSVHGGAIGALTEAGVIEGYDDGTFGPWDNIRRDHMAVMIARWLDVEPIDDGPFTDVNRYVGEINALNDLGVINGTTDTTFDPDADLTRAQTASLVLRVLELDEDSSDPEPGTVDLKLLATNDFHGRLVAPDDDRGGAAYLSSHLNDIKSEFPDALHVDGGDMVGATPVLSNLFNDEPTIEAMDLMGVDIVTVGNHEFDDGRDEIIRRFYDGGCLDGDCEYRGGTEYEAPNFSLLSTNVIDEDTGETLAEPYEIREIDGVDVGFIGVTTSATPGRVHPEGIQGLDFLDEIDAINGAVPVLEAEGADVIVVLMHEGGRQGSQHPDDADPNACKDFVGAGASIATELDDAVDVVVSGHTHENYVCDLDDGPLVTQAYEYGKMFTEIDLTFDAEAGEVVDRAAVNHTVTHDVDPDQDIVDLIEHYDELAGPAMQEVVGSSEVEILRGDRVQEHVLGNLATDALRDVYAGTGVDFAFQNSGGLREDLTPEGGFDENTGLYDITREDVLGVWPFGNIVALAEIDGEQLEAFLAHGYRSIGAGAFLQVSGLRVDYTIVDESGEFPEGELVNVEYWGHDEFEDGTPVDLSADAIYTIATNDFMTVGGDDYPNISDDVFSLQEPLELAVEQYLADNSPVAPEVEGRIVELPSTQ